MGPYAYPITIKRDPQTITVVEIIEITETVTIAYLESLGIGRDDHFSINYKDWDDENDTISVTCRRLENADELAQRLHKEDTYMAHYAEYHAAPDTASRIALMKAWKVI